MSYWDEIENNECRHLHSCYDGKCVTEKELTNAKDDIIATTKEYAEGLHEEYKTIVDGELENFETDLTAYGTRITINENDISAHGVRLTDCEEGVTTNTNDIAENTRDIKNLKTFVTPEMYGAVGDGVTDDTEAIQSAIDSNNCVVFSKNYLTDTIHFNDINDVKYIGFGCKFIKSGDGTLFQYSGTIKNVFFSGISADGAAVSDGAFWYGTDLEKMENVIFDNCDISNFTTGISFNADRNGEIKNVGVYRCKFNNIRGYNSGYGYGVHMASQHDSFVDGTVAYCYFNNCNRHAIYFARGNGYKAFGNLIENHKQSSWNASGSPSISAAINVSRSWNVIVEGNYIINNRCGGIRVSSHLTNIEEGYEYELDQYKADNINIINNNIQELTAYAIILGWTDATLGVVGQVSVQNNNCDGGLYIGCAETATIDNNRFVGHTGISQTQAIALINKREEYVYSSYIRISNNILSTNDNNKRVIRVAASAKDDYIDIFNNINLSSYALIDAAALLTNVAILDSNSGLGSGTTYRNYKIN